MTEAAGGGNKGGDSNAKPGRKWVNPVHEQMAKSKVQREKVRDATARKEQKERIAAKANPVDDTAASQGAAVDIGKLVAPLSFKWANDRNGNVGLLVTTNEASIDNAITDLGRVIGVTDMQVKKDGNRAAISGDQTIAKIAHVLKGKVRFSEKPGFNYTKSYGEALSAEMHSAETNNGEKKPGFVGRIASIFGVRGR